MKELKLWWQLKTRWQRVLWILFIGFMMTLVFVMNVFARMFEITILRQLGWLK